jgi:filamentous hemagglutinin family protein
MDALMKLDIHSIFLASIFSVSISYTAEALPAFGQVKSDNELPTPTLVNQLGSLAEIRGGTEAGSNLFHSFDTFSLIDGDIAQFFNDNSSIKNVIGRVTSLSPSKIDGIIKVGGSSPTFNLFLLNSNGIIFGPHSSLDLKGSFVATTANAIQFGNQGTFNTSIKNDPSTLKINPSAFLFNQIRPPSIKYQSDNQSVTGLTVPNDQSLILLGGDVDLNGGKLTAPDGRVELGGLQEPGIITLDMNGGILRLSFPDKVARTDIFLNGQSDVNVMGTGVGSIALNAQNITISEFSELLSGIQSAQQAGNSKLGDIVLDASGLVTLNESFIISVTERFGMGDSGSISINADALSMSGTSAIGTFSFGKGNAGDIILNIRNGVSLTGSDQRFTTIIGSGVRFDGEGNSGNITIRSGWLSLSDGAIIRSTVEGRGDTGNISIYADNSVSVENNSQYFTTQIRTAVEAGAIGNGGNIDIHARSLSLTGGGQLSAAVLGPVQDLDLPGGQGRGGNISVTTSDSVIISGVGDDGFFSGIFADIEPGATGRAGKIDIITNLFKINNGAGVEISNSQGQAGILSVNANYLTLNNGTIIADTAGIATSNGAKIDLTISDLLQIENESLISAKASDNAGGGDIVINTPLLLAFPPTGSNGSDIRATAFSGPGGKITINAQGVFGIQEREAISGNQTNDIDARSRFGQSGQVQINTTTDPNQGLVELPATVIDPSTLVAQNPCRRASSSEFTRSGRGGLPPSLSQDLNGESTQVGLVEPTHLSAATPEPKSASKETSPLPLSSAKIVPAQGWVYNNKGEVVLVAYNSAVTGPQRLQSTPAGCPVF